MLRWRAWLDGDAALPGEVDNTELLEHWAEGKRKALKRGLQRGLHYEVLSTELAEKLYATWGLTGGKIIRHVIRKDDEMVLEVDLVRISVRIENNERRGAPGILWLEASQRKTVGSVCQEIKKCGALVGVDAEFYLLCGGARQRLDLAQWASRPCFDLCEDAAALSCTIDVDVAVADAVDAARLVESLVSAPPVTAPPPKVVPATARAVKHSMGRTPLRALTSRDLGGAEFHTPPASIGYGQPKQFVQSLGRHPVLTPLNDALQSSPLTTLQNRATRPSARSGASEDDEGDRAAGEKGWVGLRNLGNTCFMNAALQAIFHTLCIRTYFLKKRWRHEINRVNPIGMKGKMAERFADLLEKVWSGQHRVIAPRRFKAALETWAPQFAGFSQHDTHEFLSFLLDGLHEDLNRVLDKPYIKQTDLCSTMSEEAAAKKAWEQYLQRNDSIIVDHFQGQLKSRVECPDCGKVSIVFDPFMSLSVPVHAEDEDRKEAFIVMVDTGHDADPVIRVRVLLERASSVADAKRAAMALCEELPGVVLPPAHMMMMIEERQQDDELAVPAESALMPSAASSCYFLVPIRELPECGSVPSLLTRLVVFRHGVSIPGRVQLMFRRSMFRLKSFGVPLALRIPVMATYDAVSTVLEQQVRSWLRGASRASAVDGSLDVGGSLDESSQEQDANRKAAEKAPVGEGATYGRYWLFKASGSSVGLFRSPREAPILMPGATFLKRAHIDDYRGLGRIPVVLVEWDYKMWKERFSDSLLRMAIHPSAKGYEREQRVGTAPTMHLTRCLELYLTPETLDEADSWHCPACKEFKRAQKRFELWKLPEVLVLQLKRFSFNGQFRRKLDAPIDIPLAGLDMSPYLSGPKSDDPEEMLYDCYAIVNHMGGLGGGHYTAHVRYEDDKWLGFDDASVHGPLREMQPASRKAYILFYQRRKRLPVTVPPPSSASSQQGPPKEAADDGVSQGGASNGLGDAVAAAAAAAAAPLPPAEAASKVPAALQGPALSLPGAVVGDAAQFPLQKRLKND